jgi:hypothetical protein
VEEPVITFQQQHLRTEHFGQATLYKMLKQTGTSQEEVSTPMVPRTTNNATQREIKQVRRCFNGEIMWFSLVYNNIINIQYNNTIVMK